MKYHKILSRPNASIWGIYFFALMLWLFASWFIADYILNTRINVLIQDNTAAINQQAANIAEGIGLELEDLHGIPTVVARDGGVLSALSGFGADTSPSPLPVEQRKKNWSEDTRLKKLDGYLNLVGTSMREDVVYIMNAAGDCVAASNVNKPDSFVGTNYAGREYFREAMAGEKGYQYAMGKKSNIPGMFFSAPVTLDGRIVGVVAAKINLPALLHFVNHADAFIADEYGVIILAQDPKLEMRSLPGAAIAGLSGEDRIARYKRGDFPVLSINPWHGQRGAGLLGFDAENEPLVLTDKTLEEDKIKVHVFRRLPEIFELVQERLRQFALIGISGAVVFMLIRMRIILLRARKQTEEALRISALKHQMLFESSRDALNTTAPPSWKFTGANQATLQLFGVASVAEFTSLGPWDVSPARQPDGRLSSEKAQEMIAIAIREGSHFFEWEHKRLDGQPFISEVLLTRMEQEGELFLLANVHDITMRKQEEMQLSNSLSLLNATIESTNDAILVVDLNNKWVLRNRSFVDLWHITDEMIASKDDNAVLLNVTNQLKDADAFLNKVRELYATPEATSSDTIEFKDGKIVERFSMPQRIEGKVVGRVWSFRDVTERKLSEELLHKSAAEIEDLYTHAPCGYHSLDKDGVIQRINDTELQWLGYTRGEVVGKLKFSDLLTPSSRQAFQKNFVLFKKHGFIKDFEYEMVRKNGSILYGLVNSSIIYDASNEYISSRSTVFDITERKKMEDTLRSLFAALEHSPIAVMITDHLANILYVSSRYTEITGYSTNEIAGQNLRILQAGSVDNNIYLKMWDVLTEGGNWHGELLNKSKQGREYWEDVQITPVKTPAGEVSNYVVVSADISERKAAEEIMRHLANYDPLTDLPNRSLVDDRLLTALAAAKRDKSNMALMFLDLDNFKPINDTLGHEVGDKLLKEASRRMQDCVRESDTVGRIGGDEFIVLLPTVDSDKDAMQVAEKIRYSLNQCFVLNGQDLQISSSIGVSIYPEHGGDGKTLLKNADTAMYFAKLGGRNNVRLFEKTMLERE